MTEDELRKRTKELALRVMRLADALPDTPAGRVIRYQLVKAGTSVGSNYRAACRARSKADLIAKLAIVDAKLMKASLVRPLLDEANSLTKIMTSSRITAARGARRNQKPRISNQKSKMSLRSHA